MEKKTEKTYYADGKLKEEYDLVDGQLHGNYSAYYSSGKLMEQCNYVNGKIHGSLVTYDSEGRIIERSTYINGYKIEFDERHLTIGGITLSHEKWKEVTDMYHTVMTTMIMG